MEKGMEQRMGKVIPLVARILISVIFLMGGWHKLMDTAGTMGYMQAMGMTTGTQALAIAAGIVELVGGLSLLLGYKAKWGAWLLFLYLIPVTFVFHRNFSDMMQMVEFMKNLAIMGGLLCVAQCGGGELSVDGKCGCT